MDVPEPLHHPEGVSITRLIVGLLTVLTVSAVIGTGVTYIVVWLKQILS